MLKEKWEEAKKIFETRNAPGIAQQLIDCLSVSINCTYWGEPGRCGILIRFKDPVTGNGLNNKSFKGFEIIENPGQNSASESGKVSLIEIVERSPELHYIFTLFCENLIHKIENKPTSLSAYVEIDRHIKLWKKYMSEISEKELSLEKIKGLFGELMFLKETLFNVINPEKAVKAWRGPQKKPQDFVFDNVAIEVKTSSEIGEKTILISNKKQLDNRAFDYLFLYYIRVIETGSGNTTINQLVSSILDQIQTFPEAEEKFLQELGRLHYIPGSKINEKYDQYGLAIESETPFEITDEFPCLTDVRYLKDIPWVEDVRYSLKIDYLKSFRIEDSEFKKKLSGASHGN